MATRKNSSDKAATAKRGRGQAATNGAADRNTTVWSNPLVSSMVWSQVENADLVSQRRGQFVRTAINLFSRKGYHATTIREIADEAGVSPGLIYQYVTDKEDILFLALQLIVDTNERVIPAAMEVVEHPIHKFVVAFDAYCRVFDANRDAALLTYRETKSLSRKYRDAIKQMEITTNKLIVDCINTCIAEGWLEPQNVELFVYQVIMTAHTWALKYWRLKDIVSVDGYIQNSLNFMMKAAATEKGWQAYVAFTPTRGFATSPPITAGRLK
jgi:AcrR family transcriptional regulator